MSGVAARFGDAPTVPIELAGAGELVEAMVGRPYKRRQSAHLAVMDRQYGPNGRLRWVRALCGRAQGRASASSFGDPTCKLCARYAGDKAAARAEAVLRG